MKKLFTSESVGKGHPDKVCDQISDAILDAYLLADPYSKVAIETLASGHKIMIAGEVSSQLKDLDHVAIAKYILNDLGYLQPHTEFYLDIKAQSPDIAMGVDLEQGNIGAGDQGLMFGYATNETKELMPLAIMIAHKLVKKAEELRKTKAFKWAGADMKSQVTLDYSDPKKTKIDTILMSIQHTDDYAKDKFNEFVKNKIILPVISEYGFKKVENRILINPTGNFVIGGPIGDTGLTGRKIIVDTYGGYARHGGGAFSGKDATKVDRSAAYAARWIAKNIVAANLADQVEIQLAYAIGESKPVSILVNTFNTNKISEEKIAQAVNHIFDLTPKGIIESLKLRKPIFLPTAAFGHFGREEKTFTWEKTNKVEQLLEFVKNN
ncbi:methionine adenosyltransferase [Mycoplasmopsis alligatoris]|uniref:S-adenosylmethionine synthase n=1 Tax=Mycoplasmopsis alligatoris A21JP2 TaxID=747682 RepID=D4XVL1_9BACT|nr:methionine adenosyltransferase [Mycoplasmopsis alligatoris]EFF41685.1 methionine adenosyltransferase [Mycoplasmopsis alligatoris A21JP2]